MMKGVAANCDLVRRTLHMLRTRVHPHQTTKYINGQLGDKHVAVRGTYAFG